MVVIFLSFLDLRSHRDLGPFGPRLLACLCVTCCFEFRSDAFRNSEHQSGFAGRLSPIRWSVHRKSVAATEAGRYDIVLCTCVVRMLNACINAHLYILIVLYKRAKTCSFGSCGCCRHIPETLWSVFRCGSYDFAGKFEFPVGIIAVYIK